MVNMNTYGIDWLKAEVTKRTDASNPAMSSVISNLRFSTGAGAEIPDWVLLYAYYEGGGQEAESDGHVFFEQAMKELLAEYREAKAEATRYSGPWMTSFTLMDMQYGGPEEGGWYFSTFDPTGEECRELNRKHHALRVFWGREEAETFVKTFAEAIKNANAGRPSMSSVLSRGEFTVMVFEGVPTFLPVERPTYE